MKNTLARPWLWISLVALSPLLIAYVVFELFRYPISVPLGYQGDAYFSAFVIKHIQTHGLSYQVPELGYPFGLELFDFPFADASYFGLTFIVGLVSTNPFVSLNLLYLSSFVMISLTAWWVWRQMGISAWHSWWGSLLFSFLPYHLLRGPYHLFLGNYWFIPLVIMIAVWLMNPSFFPLPGWMKNPHQKIIGLALMAVVTATGGIYYALFSIFLFGMAGIVALIQRLDWRTFAIAAGLSLLIATGVGIQFLPTFIYTQQVGKNQEAGIRHGFEADNNSLALLRMAMPLQDIGLESMKDHTFDSTRPLVDMEKRQFLGWGGLLGLVLIAYRALLRPSTSKKLQARWHVLFIFTLAMWVLAMTGGLGTIMAFVISPQIRAYGRILPFLAFIAITGLLMWLEEFEATHDRAPLLKKLSLFSTLILLGSLWSQLSWYRPPTSSYITSFRSDQDFFAQIDALAPTAVYQLPYKPFPETPEIENLSDYDLLKGYLHAEQPILWSYASMKGRAGATWLQAVSQFPLDIQLQSIKEVGFDGLYLDRFGWADNGAAIEASLSGLIRQTPLVSKDGRLVYYQL